MESSENITVLFTDIVGSTELLTSVDPAVAFEQRRAHMSLLRRAVASSGGTEVKSLGDGLMVVFRTASAGLACAVEMQQLAEFDGRDSGTAMGLRVGLSGGEVIRDGEDYFGDPVVEAARLCAKAKGGQILASDLVRATAGRRVSHPFVHLGALELKGFPEPLSTFEVGWEALEVPDGRGLDEIPLPYRLSLAPPIGVIGRVGEASRLEEAYRRVLADQGREVLLISGEPGVGKTTITAQFARAAHEGGAVVLLGRCDEDMKVPFGPVSEALNHYVTHCSEEVLQDHVQHFGAQLGELVPSLRQRLGDLPDPENADPEIARHLLFRSVVGLLKTIASHNPAVLVVDDLHWADADTLQLLRHLAGALEPRRFLLIATFRSSEFPSVHQLTETLAALQRQPGVGRVELSGLADRDVLTFVETTTGHALDDTEIVLAHELFRETDGNPFFLGELLSHLAETGAMGERRRGEKGGPSEASRPAGSSSLPHSVRQVIAARVANLGEPARRILLFAAVIGREFDVELLAAVADLDQDELIDALEAACAASLVNELLQTPGNFRFAHALIQRALYASLGVSRRAQVHRQVAETLGEGGRTGIEADVFEVARHWQLGARISDGDQVAHACRLAAQRSAELRAFSEAVRWYEAAIERARGLSPASRSDLLLELGRVKIQANDIAGGRGALREAAGLVTGNGRGERLAEIGLAYHGPMRVTIRDPAERELLERALTAIGPDGDQRLRGRLLAHLSAFCYDDTDPGKLTLAEEAVALADQSGDLRATYAAHRALFWPQFGRPEGNARALECADRALSAADLLGDLQARIEGHWLRLLARAQRGVGIGSMDDLAVLDELAERSGLVAEQRLCESIRIRRVISEGRFAEAEDRLAHPVGIGEPDAVDLVGWGTQIAEICRWTGRLEETLQLVDPSTMHVTLQIANLIQAVRVSLLSESRIDYATREEIHDLAHGALESLTGVGSWTHVLELAALAECRVQ